MDDVSRTVIFLQSDPNTILNLYRIRFFLYFRRQYLNAIDLSGTNPVFSCIKMKRSVCTVVRLRGIQYKCGAVVFL